MIDVDAVSLVVNELIGRLSHAAGDHPDLDVRVDVNPTRLRVHVTGPARGEDVPPEPTLTAGWSLLLMERTVDRWGIDEGPATRLWFEIDLPGADPRVAGTPGRGSTAGR
jgi:hypothetical protein